MKNNSGIGPRRMPALFKRAVRIAAAAGVAACVVAQPAAQAQAAAPGKNDAIYQYRGADRDKQLEAKAKAEGTLTWYTSMSPAESRPLAEAFEKKYGIKVELWRGPNEQLVQRAMTEARSRRNIFDAIETNATEAEVLGHEGLLSAFYTPHAADFPSDGLPPDRVWALDRFNFLVAAYNTNKVKREDVPKSFEGFADQKWKGKLAIESGDWDWMATIQQKAGKEQSTAFFQKLAADVKPEMRKGHPLLAQLVGAGEVPVGLTAFLSNVLSGKQKGTPIDFVPVQPVLALPFAIGIAKNAPHPHAALLFADFVLSPEGQEIFDKLGRLPASRKIKNEAIDFPYTMLDVRASLAESAQREKAWNALFLKR